MSVNVYFDLIESIEFQAEFLVLSGFRAFRKAMKHDETLQMLSNAASSYGEGAEDLVQRIGFLLCELEDGPGATYDVAITGYLYCLYRVKPEKARDVAASILKSGGLWWAVDMSLYIADKVKNVAEQAKPRIHSPSLLRQTFTYPVLRYSDVTKPKAVEYVTGEVNIWSTCGLSYADSPQTIETAILSV